MKTSHIAAWTTLTLVLTLASGVFWRARQAAGIHRRAQSEAERNQVRLRAELDELQRSASAKPASAELRSVAPQPLPIAPAARPLTPTLPVPASESPVGPQRGQGQLTIFPLIADPRLQALRLDADRATLATTYGAFFAMQGLDPAQRKRFVDLIVEHNAALHDIALIREQQKLAYNDPALARNREKLVGELRAAQTALLGEARFTALQAYEHTLSLRGWVNDLAGVLALTDVPLAPAQGEALVQALAQNHPRYQRGGVAQLAQVDWASFEAVAPAILTPAQFPLVYAHLGDGPIDRVGFKLLLALGTALEKHTAANAGGKN